MQYFKKNRSCLDAFGSLTTSMPTQFENFKEVVSYRRSCRKFDQKPIPEEVVRSCLELALLAPNSSNLQAWEFHWVRDPGKREKLVEACFSQPAAKTAGELIFAVARTKTFRENAKLVYQQIETTSRATGQDIPKGVAEYYKKLIPFVYTLGPLSLFGFGKWLFYSVAGLFRPVPREPINKGERRTWAVKTTALACENLMLAFAAAGYDTCPMEGLDSKRVRRTLGLPRDAVVVMGIAAGKRLAEGIYGPRLRLPSDRFIKIH